MENADLFLESGPQNSKRIVSHASWRERGHLDTAQAGLVAQLRPGVGVKQHPRRGRGGYSRLPSAAIHTEFRYERERGEAECQRGPRLLWPGRTVAAVQRRAVQRRHPRRILAWRYEQRASKIGRQRCVPTPHGRRPRPAGAHAARCRSAPADRVGAAMACGVAAWQRGGRHLVVDVHPRRQQHPHDLCVPLRRGTGGGSAYAPSDASGTRTSQRVVAYSCTQVLTSNAKAYQVLPGPVGMISHKTQNMAAMHSKHQRGAAVRRRLARATLSFWQNITAMTARLICKSLRNNSQ
jgi:hypothetical protein